MYVSENENCCALNDITSLQDHLGEPEEAMKDFCRNILSCGDDYVYGSKYPVADKPHPGAFYVFTAVTRVKDIEDNEPHDCGYGEEFAEYIQKHNLGSLRESPARINRIHHPSHYVKVWIWAPHQKNLLAWWKKYGDKD